MVKVNRLHFFVCLQSCCNSCGEPVRPIKSIKSEVNEVVVVWRENVLFVAWRLQHRTHTHTHTPDDSQGQSIKPPNSKKVTQQLRTLLSSPLYVTLKRHDHFRMRTTRHPPSARHGALFSAANRKNDRHALFDACLFCTMPFCKITNILRTTLSRHQSTPTEPFVSSSS
jgi:hypothetical protein